VHGLEDDAAPLQCTLDSGAGNIIEAEPIDLSLTGMLVRAADPILRGGQSLTVTMSLRDLHTPLSATVVRAQPPLLALHFVESLQDGELDPPETLIAIYRELERRWLRNRVVTTGQATAPPPAAGS
jgi:hypothetical protein